MFIARFGIIAVVVIMLLPTGPTGPADRHAGNQGFCARYPKTCDASGELFDAFKKKLAYGITLARQALVAQTIGSEQGRVQSGYTAEKLDGRVNAWRPPARQPGSLNRYDTLARDERSPFLGQRRN